LRFLADEDFPGAAVAMLRQRGHDVVWASEDYSSTMDTHLLEIARRDGRIILTLDKDFGDLAYQKRLPILCGIVLFRGKITSLRRVSEFAVEVLESRNDWPDNFTVVGWSRIRMKPLDH